MMSYKETRRKALDGLFDSLGIRKEPWFTHENLDKLPPAIPGKGRRTARKAHT